MWSTLPPTVKTHSQKFMTLSGELSWQRLRRSAVPGIWLCQPKFKWFTWRNHARSGMPYHPRASNCYRQSTYQIWSLYLHSLQRVWASLKVAVNSTNRYSTYELLLAFHSNYPCFTPLVRYSQILVENRRFNVPHFYLAPPSGVTPLEFRRDLWHQKTRMIALSCGIKISPVGSLD